jgi:hypothetical protein
LVDADCKAFFERLGVEKALVWAFEAGLRVARRTQIEAADDFVAVECVLEAVDAWEGLDRCVFARALGVVALHLAINHEGRKMTCFLYKVGSPG